MASFRDRVIVLEEIIKHDALIKILIQEMELHKSKGGVPQEELFEDVQEHLTATKRSISEDLSDLERANVVKIKLPGTHEVTDRTVVLNPEVAEILKLAGDIASS